MFNINSDVPKGVYIDIFPIEYVPENKYIRFLKVFCEFNTLYWIFSYDLSITKRYTKRVFFSFLSW